MLPHGLYFKIVLMEKDDTEIGRHLLACIFRLKEEYDQSFSEDVIIGVIKGTKVTFNCITVFDWGKDISESYLLEVFSELK